MRDPEEAATGSLLSPPFFCSRFWLSPHAPDSQREEGHRRGSTLIRPFSRCVRDPLGAGSVETLGGGASRGPGLTPTT